MTPDIGIPTKRAPTVAAALLANSLTIAITVMTKAPPRVTPWSSKRTGRKRVENV